MLDINRMADVNDLQVGMEILIPGAQIEQPKPIIASVPKSTSNSSVTYVPSSSTYNPPPGVQFISPTGGVGNISTCYSSIHQGVDIASHGGPPLYASAAGKIEWAGWGLSGGSGIAVSINHGNGYITQYLHLSKLSVSVGDYVEQGQMLGIMGSTGKSTGTHVHFIIKYNGNYVNPFNYVDLSSYPRVYTATSC